MGDQASTFGYIYNNGMQIPRFWTGTRAVPLGNHFIIVNNTINATPFLSEECLFQGVAELAGMSGGPTANGIGYTGLVHGTFEIGRVSIFQNFSIYISSFYCYLL
jgi:hypothetical protein